MHDLADLRDKFTGKRMYVIGNGPSLSRTPMDMLIGEYSIAMNRIAAIYNQTKWRPDFFVCTTINVRKPDWHRDIMRTIDQGIVTFAWDQLRKTIGEKNNIYYLNCTHGSETTDEPQLEWWSDDISERVCKYGTSMLVAMQIAFYLGFGEIYIVGADLGFTDSIFTKLFRFARLDKIAQLFDKNHFFIGYGSPGASAKYFNRNMIATHQLIKEVANRKKIKIYNATLGGKLNVYPRVDFTRATKAGHPNYLNLIKHL